MRRLHVIVVSLALAMAGCSSSSAVDYVDVADFPTGYLGKSYRAWTEGSQVLIEVDEISGMGVGFIHHRVEGDTIYLSPRQASCCGGGKRIVRVDLSSEKLAEGWEDRLYWLTQEYHYPIMNSGFWDKSQRRPSERVKLKLGPPPDSFEGAAQRHTDRVSTRN